MCARPLVNQKAKHCVGPLGSRWACRIVSVPFEKGIPCFFACVLYGLAGLSVPFLKRTPVLV
jgi:hypothetical protein